MTSYAEKIEKRMEVDPRFKTFWEQILNDKKPFDEMTSKEKRTHRLKIANEKGSHTKKDWIEMKNYFNNTCVKCNGKKGYINVDKDHIIPLYKGGDNSVRNLQPLCAHCNAEKGPECTDYREKFCIENKLTMPEKYKQIEK